MILFSIAIVSKISMIQFVQGEKWKERANRITYQFRPVKATRGNIYSDNGSLLATSLPFYKVAIDPTVPSDKIFNGEIDSLAHSLSQFFGEKSPAQYARKIRDARLEGRQYMLISRREINFHQKKGMMNWPLFRHGRYKGGVIFEKVDKRFNPFHDLSRRTVGFINENKRGAGLEYSFNEVLAGEDGEAMYQKIAGGNWKPVFDGSEVKSMDGYNITTTIDVNLQDVSETALRRSLKDHGADYGLVVVMEVETGEIKAISNLSKVGGGYYESYNYAVGGLHEPGSTFKLLTMIALLEETSISLNDSIDTGDGVYQIYNNRVRDHHEGGWGKMTIKESFEKSSNVAMAKLVEKHFGLDPEKYISYIDQLHLSKPLDFQIMGGGDPKIVRPGEPGWSGITLPWMSHGYGLEITPLQTLTLYNAVANGGKMIKPIIVSSTGQAQNTVDNYKTEVLNPRICSPETLTKLKLMLEGVVENGTANNIKGTHYKIAGKTGTAQILENGRYSARYITSFAGYFPAHSPKYSAIVLIKNPKGWRQYGSNVAAPVFKEIADNIYSRDIEMHDIYNDNEVIAEDGIFPLIRAGNRLELERICNEIGIANHREDEVEWVRTATRGNAVLWKSNEPVPGLVPNVKGMTLRDALFLLESSGLKVVHNGIGRVSEQSIIPGRKIVKGATIKLELDI